MLYYKARGQTLERRYSEIMRDGAKPQKSADEVIKETMTGGGLRFKDGCI